MTSSQQHPLQEARQIGLLGDVHGDIEALLAAVDFMAAQDVRVLIQLGDLGLLWDNGHWQGDVNRVSKHLVAQKVTLAWVDGNHDFHPLINSFPVNEDGLRPIALNIVHLPRGYRTVLSSGKSFAALGGANSIDRAQRSAKTWWAEEAITEDDLARLSDERAEILVGHDAPRDILTLDRALAATDKYWSPSALAYARDGRATFDRGLRMAAPSLYVGAHYHVHIDETVGYVAGDRAIATRVVLLDMVQHSGTASAAILDVHTLELRKFTYFGKPLPSESTQVTELTMASEGRWLVHTTGSQHLFDFNAGTVERRPGPNTHATTSDGVHALRSIEACAIGARGRWTMQPEDEFTEFLWHVSSVIQHIEPLPPVGA